jgi:hypothetical protein
MKLSKLPDLLKILFHPKIIENVIETVSAFEDSYF